MSRAGKKGFEGFRTLVSRIFIKYINYDNKKKKTLTTDRVLDQRLQKKKLTIKQGCYIVQGTFKTFCRTDSVI